MRSFLIIRQVFANAVDHHQNECAVIHIQPVGTADELIGAVSSEGTVNIFAKVWLVKPRLDFYPAFRVRGYFLLRLRI